MTAKKKLIVVCNGKRYTPTEWEDALTSGEVKDGMTYSIEEL